MRKKPFAYSLTKNLLLIFLGAVIFAPGCRKSKQSDPCEGVVSEGTPTQVGLILIDGQTGENILLSKNIDTATISIIPEGTGLPPERGVIVKEPRAPMYGSLMFHIADTKKGAFKYTINIPDVDRVTLSYTNIEKESGNKCNPYYITVTDPVIVDHQFTVSQTGSRVLFKVTI
ncbi:hypothetical protein [Chitinophaga tropicalis]|uniref:Uncharacterized protein n=1 Tax=Chitinophaga tropicalis TaxID=2683588 RepID=A0A7K1U0D6_9BACT|nr:hypothetical protein [Chitinophaga tropicalis]MVT07828.1 hypothetical protein [Chitinophaga tropicalis]